MEDNPKTHARGQRQLREPDDSESLEMTIPLIPFSDHGLPLRGSNTPKPLIIHCSVISEELSKEFPYMTLSISL